MKQHYMGVDMGTESVRTAIFTDAGEVIASARRSLATFYPQPGWAEQDANQWWTSVAAAIRECVAQANGIVIDAIVPATTSSSVVFLDEAGDPTHPVILWMDQRASDEAEFSRTLDHAALLYSGGGDSAEWLVPKAAWLARNRPEIYEASAHVMEAHDYLIYRMTGKPVGSRLIASCKWNYVDGVLPQALYSDLGVPDLCEKLPSEILAVGAVAGKMLPTVARLCGLQNQPEVVVGGIDAHISLVALGLLGPDPVSLVAGTSNALTFEIDTPVFSESFWGPYPNALTQGKCLIEAGQVASGSVLTWGGEKLLNYSREDIPELVERASEIPAASHGIVALDTFMGNRTPMRDPLLRGGLLGVTLQTGGVELYRALIEGVSYGTRAVVDGLESAGLPLGDLYLSGGISNNTLWLSTTVNALNREVRLVRGGNLTLLSCAVLGRRAMMADRDGESAFAPEYEVLRPEPSEAEVLAEGYVIYRDALQSTQQIQHRIAAFTQKRRSSCSTTKKA
jgi:ribulose kinase